MGVIEIRTLALVLVGVSGFLIGYALQLRKERRLAEQNLQLWQELMTLKAWEASVRATMTNMVQLYEVHDYNWRGIPQGEALRLVRGLNAHLTKLEKKEKVDVKHETDI